MTHKDRLLLKQAKLTAIKNKVVKVGQALARGGNKMPNARPIPLPQTPVDNARPIPLPQTPVDTARDINRMPNAKPLLPRVRTDELIPSPIDTRPSPAQRRQGYGFDPRFRDLLKRYPQLRRDDVREAANGKLELRKTSEAKVQDFWLRHGNEKQALYRGIVKALNPGFEKEALAQPLRLDQTLPGYGQPSPTSLNKITGLGQKLPKGTPWTGWVDPGYRGPVKQPSTDPFQKWDPKQQAQQGRANPFQKWWNPKSPLSGGIHTPWRDLPGFSNKLPAVNADKVRDLRKTWKPGNGLAAGGWERQSRPSRPLPSWGLYR